VSLSSKIFELFTSKLEHYKSVSDLPIYNWFKIHETNDLKWLLITPTKVGLRRRKALQEAFSKLYDEFIDTFGVSDDLKKITELRRDIRVLEIDMYLENDPSRETFIDIKKAEIQSIIESNAKAKVSDVKAYVEKYMGFHLDERVTTVKDYYSYIKIMSDEATKQPING
jgi:DNA primase large subunit